MSQQQCKLALEDGWVFTGLSLGAKGTRAGEVVFNTAMLGHQETLTDPAHAGQIVTMAYTQIGNVGISADDAEIHKRFCRLAGVVVREVSPIVSNFRATLTLDDYLRQTGVIGISNIDTRALTRRIRTGGACRGVLSTDVLDDAELVRLAQSCPTMAGLNLVADVTPRETFRWTEGVVGAVPRSQTARRFRVVAVDCGTKLSVLRNLVDCGGDVTVVPATASAAEILEHKPQGVFVSHGPGDPAAVTGTVQTLRDLVGKVPMFGLGLGHLLLALAIGGRTFKLPFGHHGVNHPVRNVGSGTEAITSQNHGFAAAPARLAAAGASVTHLSLNDQTVEGFTHPSQALFGVQFLPDTAPGPYDATYVFDCFADMAQTGQAPSAETMHTAQERLRKAY